MSLRRTGPSRPCLPHALACAAALCAAGAVQAQTSAPAPQQVRVTGHYDNAVGTSDSASEGRIEAALLKSRPAQRPGEVLEFVPGVIVTQHSGDGKANQYFLRGFNLDHGTDFATSVDGVPVNMPSHAHGQGYTDLNFLIPELVQRIDYRKGPYFARGGDFSSAGAADIRYAQRLDENFGVVTLGERGYRRAVGGVSGTVAAGTTGLAAVEVMGNDGPWVVPERLRRHNVVLGLSGGDSRQGWSLRGMSYEAHWTATDQIPQRLIDAGFNRFGSLDPTAGGSTGRYSVSGEWHRDSGSSRTRISGYAMRYRLNLSSNFTYALDREDDGDQFQQRDSRGVYGLQATQGWTHRIGPFEARSELGFSVRHDRAHVGLYDTVARNVTATTRADRVQQTFAGAWAQTQIGFSDTLRGVFGLRTDHIANRVHALSLPENGGRADATQVSPRMALVLGPFAAVPKTEFFVNAGRGLHSNDARGTTIRVDPKSGEAADRVPALVSSKGWELGTRTEIVPGLQSSLALWWLNFDSELVYVGDAGATEASAGSRRRGVEFNNRYTPTPWLLVDADLAWTHARFANGDRIPNAVDRVASVAFTLRELGPWSASLQWRYLGTGALIEDNSVRSLSALTTNLRVSRDLPALRGPAGWVRQATLTLDVFNLGNRRVDDIQYFYPSRLRSEASGSATDDRHVHPAEPRTVRMSLRLAF